MEKTEANQNLTYFLSDILHPDPVIVGIACSLQPSKTSILNGWYGGC